MIFPVVPFFIRVLLKFLNYKRRLITLLEDKVLAASVRFEILGSDGWQRVSPADCELVAKVSTELFRYQVEARQAV